MYISIDVSMCSEKHRVPCGIAREKKQKAEKRKACPLQHCIPDEQADIADVVPYSLQPNG